MPPTRLYHRVVDRAVQLRDRLQERTIVRKILGNASWLMLERAVNLTVRFFVGVWVVRYLGPDQFGIYSYSLSFVALFTALAGLGLDNIVVRDLAGDTDRSDEVISTALMLRIVGAVAAYGLVALTIGGIDEDPMTRAAVWIVGLQLPFLTFNVFDLWFQAQVRAKHVVVARSVATLLFSAAQVVAILMGASVLAFAWLFLGYTALSAIAIGVAFRILGPPDFSWRPRRSVALGLMRDAWPLIVSGLSVTVYMRIDQVMLGQMAGDQAVGVYAAAVKLSELWYFVPGAAATSVFPEIVRIRSRESAGTYRHRMQMFYDHMCLLGYGIAVGMSILAVPLIDRLFGPAYDGAAAILQVHLWSIVFVTLGVARTKWLIAENLVRFSMVTALLGAVTNILLNLWLIPTYSGLGAAWATLVAQICSAYLACALLTTTRPAFIQMTKALLYPIRMLRTLRGTRSGRA